MPSEEKPRGEHPSKESGTLEFLDNLGNLYCGKRKEEKKEDTLPEKAWFVAESNRAEQEQIAHIHLDRICAEVDRLFSAGLCPQQRWTNDPEVFPHDGLGLTGAPLKMFVPHDQSFYVCGEKSTELSRLAVPSHMRDLDGNSTWVRLIDFAPNAHCVSMFDDTLQKGQSFGRVIQGTLDNGYFVEALQAIAMRPKLCRQLFYCWNMRRSVYIARLYINGTWQRVEVDDYVPVGPPSEEQRSANAPICCRSENFPYVLWPSLIEKAYAKAHTVRLAPSGKTPQDKGGWEALGGGGSVEEALVDLTGGVAGRFHTSNVNADRLFLYMHDLQRDTLFVARPNEDMCEIHGVALNPYYPNVVNRVAEFEGRLYVQMFSGAPGVFDGGLQDEGVPWALVTCDKYPENLRPGQGFYWITAHDFREYFGTVFECRLPNSGDVALQGMPPPRLPGVLAGMSGMMHGMPGMMPGMIPPGIPPGSPGNPMPAVTEDGYPVMHWFETIWANPGGINSHNAPEFTIPVPHQACPCEVLVSVDQVDLRGEQLTAEREPYAPILIKVYEQSDSRGYYSPTQGSFMSKWIPIKSNWIPIRNSMVGFCCLRGGEYKIVAEFPDRKARANRMIFRCYANKPNVVNNATAAKSLQSHLLVEPMGPPKAMKWTFVGFIRPEAYQRREIHLREPEPFDLNRDSMRKAEFDVNDGVSELVDEVKRDCVLM
jgi:hypothetical protein